MSITSKKRRGVKSYYSFVGNNKMWLGGYLSSANGRGGNINTVAKFGAMNVTDAGILWLHGYGGSEENNIYVGAGGINLTSTGYVGVENSSHSPTLWPWKSDYAIGRGNNANYDLRLQNDNIKLNIQTKDEDDVARTVTLNGRITTEAKTSATLPATVKVKISSANGKRAKGGAHVLTSGGAFTGANVELVPGYPDWVKGVSVVDGEIVFDVKCRGLSVTIR